MITKIPKSFLMYVGVGSINTIAHQIVYLNMLNYHNPYFANALGFCASIIVSFYLNTKYTFASDITFDKMIKFPLSYIPHILGSSIGIGVLIEGMNVPPRFASIIMVLIVGPIAYLIAKHALTNKTDLKTYQV